MRRLSPSPNRKSAEFKVVVCLGTSDNLRSPRISVRGMYRGELAIVRAREKADKTLGGKFNIRASHDAVLASSVSADWVVT